MPREQLREDSLLSTTNFAGIPSIHLISLGEGETLDQS